MADKYGKILARRAVYVVIAFVLVSLCPSHYNEMRFFGILSGELTIRLVFIRAFTLIPILGLLVIIPRLRGDRVGSGLRHRPGKKLTAASLAIAAVMLLGGLYISCFFLLTGWGGSFCQNLWTICGKIPARSIFGGQLWGYLPTWAYPTSIFCARRPRGGRACGRRELITISPSGDTGAQKRKPQRLRFPFCISDQIAAAGVVPPMPSGSARRRRRCRPRPPRRRWPGRASLSRTQ